MLYRKSQQVVTQVDGSFAEVWRRAVLGDPQARFELAQRIMQPSIHAQQSRNGHGR